MRAIYIHTSYYMRQSLGSYPFPIYMSFRYFLFLFADYHRTPSNRIPFSRGNKFRTSKSAYLVRDFALFVVFLFYSFVVFKGWPNFGCLTNGN